TWRGYRGREVTYPLCDERLQDTRKTCEDLCPEVLDMLPEEISEVDSDSDDSFNSRNYRCQNRSHGTGARSGPPSSLSLLIAGAVVLAEGPNRTPA
ncbi:MAG: hypothetical protein JSU86_13905, partial [Phycisphaerales bacterium]